MNILSPLIRSANNPQSSLSNPANWLIDLVGGASSSGEPVSVSTSLGLPAVWSAVTLLSSSLAMLPLNVFQREGVNKKRLDSHPVNKLIKNKPHEMLTSFQWRQLMSAYTLLWGNGYSLIKYNEARPVELVPYHPNNVTIHYSGGKYWYTLKDKEGKSTTVDSTNVIHFKGLGFDGIKGQSVISAMKDNLGLSLAAQNQGAKFYKDGMKLDGILTVPHKMKREGKDKLRTSYEETYLTKGKRLMILDGGIEYKQMGIPQADAQYIETKVFQLADVARMFRVPPPLLYDLDKASFNNISELILSFVKFSLTPWIVNIEQELNDKLFFESEKGKMFLKLNVEGLLRGDVKARGEFYQKLHMVGAISPNEIRTKENMNTYDKGDGRYIPVNMQEVGKPPLKQNDN